MKEKGIKLAIPHIAAIIIFTVVSFAYFFPVLEGKKIDAHDTKVYLGSSKEISDYRSEYGGEPLWTNSMFSGMPAYMISVRYPGNLFSYVDRILKIFNTPVAALFLSMVGFYIMLLLFKVDPWLAIAGAIAYGFSSYLFVSLSAGHNTKVYAMSYMAPVIGSAIYAFRQKAFVGAALFALFLSLQIMANHLQITYYTFMILLVFGIYELVSVIKSGNLAPFFKSLGLLVIAAIIAVVVNFASLYSTLEYSRESTRGTSELSGSGAKEGKGLDKEYITQWSYGIGESMTFLIPGFRGGATAPFKKDSGTVKILRKNNMAQAQNQLFSYWGDQPTTSGPVYFGAIILFLFILGTMIVDRKEKWWIITAVLLSLVLSWGKNLMPVTSFFIDYFPGYDRFRAVSMTLVIAGVCVPLLAVLTLKKITAGDISREKIISALFRAAAITAGLAFLFFLIPSLAGSFIRPDEKSIPDAYNWLKDAMIADRKMMLRTDAIRSFILIAVAATLLWMIIKGKVKYYQGLIALSLLFLIDQIPVDARFLGSSKFETEKAADNSMAPTIADKFILQDQSQYRVLNLTVSTFNDASTSFHHHSIGGYSGAKLMRYQEVIEADITGEMGALITVLQSATTLEEADSAMKRMPVLNMLNTKYIIISPEGMPLANSHALGNAWFVEKVSIVSNADEELSDLKNLDPGNEAVVDQRFKEQVGVTESTPAPGDTIFLTSYRPNLLTYQSELSADRIAIFSEIYYSHGWQAYIDDIPANHFRADYILRGMVLPAGKHTVTFRFRPKSYDTGNRVSLAGSLLLILILLSALYTEIVSKRNNG